MKEIDKIRIRQWNQDNPYIQMKNLENAQPGYRVHTVNDDHHLYELPLETQNIILDWVFWNFYPAQKIYPHLTSDDLKVSGFWLSAVWQLTTTSRSINLKKRKMRMISRKVWKQVDWKKFRMRKSLKTKILKKMKNK